MSRVFKSSHVIIDKNTYKLKFDDSSLVNIHNTDSQENIIENEKADEKVDEKVDEEELIAKKIEEMNQLYESKINEANEEAKRIIAEAYEKSKEIMDESRKEGFEEGKRKGFEEGKLAADSIVEEALNIKKQTQENMSKMIGKLEKDVINLTTSIVEKILGKKVQEEHDTILGLIHMGLEKCAFTEDLVLRVSLDDYDFAISSKDKILALSQNINDIIIKQDKSLPIGSCIIDTPSGSIDSSIETQFNQVKEMFEHLLRSE